MRSSRLGVAAIGGCGGVLGALRSLPQLPSNTAPSRTASRTIVPSNPGLQSVHTGLLSNGLTPIVRSCARFAFDALCITGGGEAMQSVGADVIRTSDPRTRVVK